MSRHGVCYVASDGYLFQTFVSAQQARRHVDDDDAVIVVGAVDADSAEAKVFRSIAEANDIRFVEADTSSMGDLGPLYSRLFLDRFLPEDIEEILYLDGDTQIVGDLRPLLHSVPEPGGLLAARDPMVFIRLVHAQLGRRIDRWWDGGAIPASVRPDYINTGVLRISRKDLAGLREACLRLVADGRIDDFRFHDQDAINVAAEGRIGTLSLEWNFPGFLLGTPLERENPPRVVHFMSNPRPWNAPLWPWGAEYYDAYRRFVDAYPETAPYWKRFRGTRLLRYRLQQLVKRVTEHRTWSAPSTVVAVRASMTGAADPRTGSTVPES